MIRNAAWNDERMIGRKPSHKKETHNDDARNII